MDAFQNNEKVLKRLQEWLDWTRSMKAKPKNCITSGLKHGKAIDPELKVWNSNDQWFPKWIGEDSFKFLGKSLVAELSSRSAKKNVLGKYKNSRN